MSLSALRKAVIARDRGCVIAALDRGHRCADRQGPHLPTDLDRLTLGHVREHPGGQRRDVEGWCIAQCWQSNIDHDESRLASDVRAYLAGVRAQQARVEARSTGMGTWPW